MPITHDPRCAACGQYHPALPLEFAAATPFAYVVVPPGEREDRAFLTPDQCVIDDDRFFVLADLRLPIVGTRHVFTWGVWVEVSEDEMERLSEAMEEPADREADDLLWAPISGRLDTALPGYPNTLGLPVHLRALADDDRPVVEMTADHPLRREQEQGITWERVRAITAAATRGAGGARAR